MAAAGLEAARDAAEAWEQALNHTLPQALLHWQLLSH